MPKTAKSAEPTISHELTPDRTACPHCGRPMTADYANRRTVHTLAGVTRLTLTIRRCHHAPCPAHKKPYRPEAEGSFALPRHEFGLDVVALIGRLRYAEHRSVPEIRAHLVGRGVSGLLGAMRRHRDAVGDLGPAVEHFLKVTRSYWPGLFHCYDTADLPRTNNDLERAFGSHRYHERRATGRTGASPALVLRGSARLVAGLGTRAGAGTAADLAGADRDEWKRVRAELEERRQRRVERRRFRRDPEGYLKALENQLTQSRLPA